MENNVITKIPGIKGIYGDRYVVSTGLSRLIHDLFEGIMIWKTDTRPREDGFYDITYELPLGQHLEDNPLLMQWLKHYGFGITILPYDQD